MSLRLDSDLETLDWVPAGAEPPRGGGGLANRFLGLAVVACLAMAGRWAGGQEITGQARQWSPQVTVALEFYLAGDYQAAQQACRQIIAKSTDPQAQRDAAVIEALCLSRMEGRADRLEGRARLRQLSAEDPSLLVDPECNLAYGIAQTALAETAEALDCLDRAAASFAAQGRPDRQAEALLALAEAWSRHGEWPATPARFGVQPPQSPDEARAVRRAQIEAVRARLEGLPDQDEALDRLDLLLAGYLLEADQASAEGWAILERLAAGRKLNCARAAAAWKLGQRCEAVGDRAAALLLYRRLQKEWQGDLARDAEQRVKEITRPQIVVDVPATVRPGQTIRPRLIVHGLESTELEVRQVDVAGWLADAGTRVSEAFLPESGSVRLARKLDTRASHEYGWWDSDQLDQPPELLAEPGAYVVLAKAVGEDGRVVTAKRLVLVSDLVTLCCAGREHALIWLVPSGIGPGNGSDRPPEAKFWMNRSFVPTEVALTGQVTRLALPAEARVMRDKGWVCLAQRGEHLSLCRGQLPTAASSEPAPRAALLAGPPVLSPGQSLYVAGVLLDAQPGGRKFGSDARVELEILDSLDNLRLSRSVPVSEGGMFTTTVSIPRDLVGQHLRVLARYQRARLENVAGRVPVRVLPSESVGYRVGLELPSWLPESSPVLSARVRAEYPWGTRVCKARARARFQAAWLPTADNDWGPTSPRLRREGDLEGGETTLTVPLEEFGTSQGPRVVRVEAKVFSLDGREGVAEAKVLVGPGRPQAWLTHTPARALTGQEVQFCLGWFDPDGLVPAELPEIVVRRDGVEIARLRTHPEPRGLVSESWRPIEPGLYEADTALVTFGSAPVALTHRVEVGDAAVEPPSSPIACTAHLARREGQPVVRVRLEGRSAGPVLVLAEDGDPQAAESLPRLAGSTEVLLPLPVEPDTALRVVVVEPAGDGCNVLCIRQVGPDPLEKVELRLAEPPGEVRPGTTVRLEARCSAPAGTSLIARLVEAGSPGCSEPYPESAGSMERITPGVVISCASGARISGPTHGSPGSGRFDSSEVRALWSPWWQEATLWATSLTPEDERVELAIPLPTAPGLYRLLLLARSPGGATAAASAILDGRHGLRIQVDAPKWLTLGDRTLLAVLVRNDEARSVDARLRCRLDEGLRGESGYIDIDGQPISAADPARPISITLPARSCAWLHFDAEAVTPGQWRMAAEVSADGLTGRAETEYEVRVPEAPADGTAVVRIKRTLMASSVPLPPESQADWQAGQSSDWVTVTRDSWLSPGQFLLVKEEFVLPQIQQGINWTQPVPAICQAAGRQGPTLRSIGARESGPPDVLVFQAAELAAGTHVHEYMLAVVRPGDCVLPAPVLRVGDVRLPVRVEPGDLRLTVSAGE